MPLPVETHQNRPLVGALFLGGLAILSLGQVTYQAQYPQQTAATLGISAAGAALVVLGLVTFQREKLPTFFHTSLEKTGAWLGIANWQVVLLLQALIFGLITPFAAGEGAFMRLPLVAIFSWSLGMLCAILAGWKPGRMDLRAARHVVVVSAAFFLFALAIRGIATAQFPYTLTGDEGSAGLEAANFAAHQKNNIFISGWFDFPSFFFAIPALAIRLFGQDIFALRFVSAIAGALTVACTYIVARAMFGERTAIFAAILLSAFHFHNHFSRIGLNNVWDGLWYTVVIGAFWYAWEKERRNAYLLAGLGLGISQYFYTSARSLWVLLLVWWVVAFLSDRAKLKRAIPNLTLMLAVALVASLPLLVFYARHPDSFRAPMMRVTLTPEWLRFNIESTGKPGWRIALEQLKLGFGAYFIEPVKAWYMPGSPILRPLLATFFITGLVIAGLRYRSSRFWLLFLWLAVFGMVGALSESAPAAQRYVAAAPACAILAGLGLHASAELLEKIWQRNAKYFAALAFVAVFLMSLDELYFYFFEYSPKFQQDTIHANTTIANGLAKYLADKPADTQIFFFGYPAMGFRSIPSTQYLAPHITDSFDINQPWGTEGNPQPAARQVIFIFLPNHPEDLAAVRASYPAGTQITWLAADQTPLFWAYEIDFAP